jgi:hypothetical protein
MSSKAAEMTYDPSEDQRLSDAVELREIAAILRDEWSGTSLYEVEAATLEAIAARLEYRVAATTTSNESDPARQEP